MDRREFVRTSGAVVPIGFLAGCAGTRGDPDGETPEPADPYAATPGISHNGVDAAVLGRTVRDRIGSGSFDFGWKTVGEERGRSFLRVGYDDSRERLLVENREGGGEFASYYAERDAFRVDYSGEDGQRWYSRPNPTLEELLDSFPSALQRLVRVWISGYQYGTPAAIDDGFRLSIGGGRSQVPYELANAQGHLIVTEDGLLTELSVAGIPITGSGDGGRVALDSHMTIALTLSVTEVTVSEPEWVATARRETDV